MDERTIRDILEVVGKDDDGGKKLREDVRALAMGAEATPERLQSLAKSLYIFGTMLNPIIMGLAKGATIMVDMGKVSGEEIKNLTGVDVNGINKAGGSRGPVCPIHKKPHGREEMN